MGAKRPAQKLSGHEEAVAELDRKLRDQGIEVMYDDGQKAFQLQPSHRRGWQLPACIGQAQELKKLKLIACTKLLELPKEVGKLHALLELELNDSPLKTLPKEVCQLTKLVSLTLSRCKQLQVLPKEIGQLT